MGKKNKIMSIKEDIEKIDAIFKKRYFGYENYEEFINGIFADAFMEYVKFLKSEESKIVISELSKVIDFEIDNNLLLTASFILKQLSVISAQIKF